MLYGSFAEKNMLFVVPSNLYFQKKPLIVSTVAVSFKEYITYADLIQLSILY